MMLITHQSSNVDACVERQESTMHDWYEKIIVQQCFWLCNSFIHFSGHWTIGMEFFITMNDTNDLLALVKEIKFNKQNRKDIHQLNMRNRKNNPKTWIHFHCWTMLFGVPSIHYSTASFWIIAADAIIDQPSLLLHSRLYFPNKLKHFLGKYAVVNRNRQLCILKISNSSIMMVRSHSKVCLTFRRF